MFDVIIVGSGPSGVASALGLKGKNVLMLDVGNISEGHESLQGNLFELKKTDQKLGEKILGKNFESLNNIVYPYLNPKLKAPLNKFITNGTDKLSPVKSSTFEPCYSFAKGGMANAWGAGAYEFQDFELKHFPINHSDLKDYYIELTKHIGINGQTDDLTDYLGTNDHLQKPSRKSKISSIMYKRYQKKSSYFKKNDFKIGHLRQAVLTEDHNNREKNDYSNLDFYKSYIPAIYNPKFTLDQLIKEKSINYKSQLLVQEYIEKDNSVEVKCLNLKTNEPESFQAKKLILAAGPLNTSKIVLTSYQDNKTKLPIQENAISYMPLIEPFSIGQKVEKQSVPASLGLSYWPQNEEPTWVSLYGLSGPLKSEYIMDFPISAKGRVLASKLFPSAMMIAQVFYPGENKPENFLKINTNNQIEINFTNRERGEIESKVINIFRKIGFFSHISFCKMPEAGNSFHYGCTLPMKENPKEYETYADGRLYQSKNVYIADSSNFSHLPAKNLTFSMMANALRIARSIQSAI